MLDEEVSADQSDSDEFVVTAIQSVVSIDIEDVFAGFQSYLTVSSSGQDISGRFVDFYEGFSILVGIDIQSYKEIILRLVFVCRSLYEYFVRINLRISIQILEFNRFVPFEEVRELVIGIWRFPDFPVAASMSITIDCSGPVIAISPLPNR